MLNEIFAFGKVAVHKRQENEVSVIPTFSLLVAAKLVKKGYIFEARGIQHALQLRFYDGAIVNIFGTGKSVWQGRHTDIRQEVEPLLEELRQRHRPRASAPQRLS